MLPLISYLIGDRCVDIFFRKLELATTQNPKIHRQPDEIDISAGDPIDVTMYSGDVIKCIFSHDMGFSIEVVTEKGEILLLNNSDIDYIDTNDGSFDFIQDFDSEFDMEFNLQNAQKQISSLADNCYALKQTCMKTKKGILC